jgi:hypothetical protein
MKTQLALPKIEVTPKPTKTQLIEALVAREKEIWKEKRESVKARLEPLNKELRDECFHLMSIADKDKFNFSAGGWRNEQHCDASIKLKSPKLTKLIKQIEKIDDEVSHWFNEDAAKIKIKEAMATPKAVNPLLNNPEVKDALDTLLNQIKSRPVQALTHDVEVVTD